MLAEDFVGEDDSRFFRRVHGRTLNAMNERYLFPVDEEEVRRSHLHHRLFKFIFGGKNFVGPVQEVLKSGEPRNVLDMGCGGGLWAIEMADEFPRAEVTGVDLAPIQPRMVPPNCTFELWDVEQAHLPYPDDHFDLIHARSLHTGIQDYPRLLHRLARLLRPGGLLILVELDSRTRADGRTASDIARASRSDQSASSSSSSSSTGMAMGGWFTIWEAYRRCLRRRNVDVDVPRRLHKLLTSSGEFHKIVSEEISVPIGFFPKDPLALTIGQLAWMDSDLQLLAMKPLLLSSGIYSPWEVDGMIRDAQRDLYRPVLHLSSRAHVVHARKGRD